MSAGCKHWKITRRTGPDSSFWACSNCDDAFVPAEELEAAHQVRDIAIDTASKIVFKVLGVTRQEPDEHAHVYGDDRKCSICDYSPFIGSD